MVERSNSLSSNFFSKYIQDASLNLNQIVCRKSSSYGILNRRSRKQVEYKGNPLPFNKCAMVPSLWIYNRLQFSGLIILDCRSITNFQASHVHNAVCCPEPSLIFTSLSDLDRNITIQGSNLGLFLAKRDLVDVVIIGDGIEKTKRGLLRKSKKLRCWGYRFAEMLFFERRVASVKYFNEEFSEFQKKYPFLVETNGFKMRDPPRSIKYPSEILNNFLYIGNAQQAESPSIMQSLAITHVIRLSSSTTTHSKMEHIEYLDIKIRDRKTENISQHFCKALDFIARAQKVKNARILIHCGQGISRSSTIVILYLMKTYRCTLSAAYNFTLTRRPITFPNRGFLNQLLEKEYDLYGEKSIAQDELDFLQNGLLNPIDRVKSKLHLVK